MKKKNISQDVESPFFRRWTEFVIDKRWPLLGIIVLATLVLTGQAATKMQVDSSTESFMASDSEPAIVLEELRNEFGMDSYFQIIVEGDVFTMPYLERLKSFHERLESIDLELSSMGQHNRRSSEKTERAIETTDDFAEDFGGDLGWGAEASGSIVDELTSLINVRQTVWTEEGLTVGGLMDTWPSAGDLDAFRKRVMADTELVGHVVGEAGKHSVLILRTPSMSEADSGKVYEEIVKVAEQFRNAHFDIHIAGLPAINASLNTIMQKDVGGSMGLSLLIMLVILFILFRHPLGVVGPFFVVVQAMFWTFGTMAALGSPMTMVMNAMPAFLICVGICDSIHIQSVYRDLRADGVDNREAIVRAVALTGVPVLYTTLTTCIGLLSFQFAELGAIRSLGVFAAYGVALAFLLSIVFLPIVLSFNTRQVLASKRGDGRSDWIDVILRGCNLASRPGTGVSGPNYRSRNVTLAIGMVLMVATLLGMSQIQVRHDPLEWMPADSPVRVAFDKVDEHIGGSANIDLMISEKPDHAMKSTEVIMSLSALEDHIRAYEDPSRGSIVGSVNSLVDVVKETNRAIHENNPDFNQVPLKPGATEDLLTLFENESPSNLRQLATVDMKKSLMRVRVKWLDAASYGPLTTHIEKGIQEVAGDTIQVQATGTVFNIFSVIQRIITDLIRSFGTAFVVITLMIILMLRSVKLGLIAIVPNLLPIGMVLGCMGYFGVPLDGMNLLIASISIGIAVDDTIHFHHVFKKHYDLSGDVEAALAHAFSHAGRSLVVTSLLLFCGFSVFLHATLFNVQRFGLLVMGSTLFALFADLVISPAMLRYFYRSAKQPSSVIPNTSFTQSEGFDPKAALTQSK